MENCRKQQENSVLSIELNLAFSAGAQMRNCQAELLQTASPLFLPDKCPSLGTIGLHMSCRKTKTVADFHTLFRHRVNF